MPLIVAILVASIAAVLIARLVAEIFIRLPGIYFAIGTLGFAFVVEGLARAFPGLTGGASGLVLEAPISLTRNQWYIVVRRSACHCLAELCVARARPLPANTAACAP